MTKLDERIIEASQTDKLTDILSKAHTEAFLEGSILVSDIRRLLKRRVKLVERLKAYAPDTVCGECKRDLSREDHAKDC